MNTANHQMTRGKIAELSISGNVQALLVEIKRHGVDIKAPSLRAITCCPKCGHEGPIGRDFGIRVMRGEIKPQSWCRECRANPGRKASRRR